MTLGGTFEVHDRIPEFSLRNDLVQLKPVTQEDIQALYLLETSPDLGPKWRFRGTTPGLERWTTATWGSVLANFLVLDGAGSLLGIVAAHEANFQDSHAKLSAAKLTPSNHQHLGFILGLGLFIDYVFRCWNLRKLYMEVPEYNYHQFASGEGKYFEEEARLKEHMFLDGRYWDQVVLSIGRSNWEGVRKEILRGMS